MNDAEEKHLKKQLDNLTHELDTLMFSVSHDLRAPLRAISRFSQEVLHDDTSQLSDQSKTDLGRVVAATQRMEKLIEDVLQLSRLTRRPFTSESVALSDLAAKVVDQLKSQAPERQAEFLISPGLKALGDAGLLELLLQILFDNAWKFSSKRPAARIEFGQVSKNGREAFFIRDNGAGFDMKYVEKLFTPFQRLHTDSEFPGTGMGLALAKRVIQRHEGEIWTEAQEGQGATFYFSLPARPVTTSS